jgi:hypothetical protein
MRLAITCFALLAVLPATAGTVFEVGAGGTHVTIQGALDAAALVVGASEIRVSQGTYTENLVVASLVGGADVTVTGGWDASFVHRAPDPELTVVDGTLSDRVLAVTAPTGVLVVEGLSFVNGVHNDIGAGVMVDPGSGGSLLMTLRSCVVRSNQLVASDSVFGAGVYGYAKGTSRIVIDDCEIADNTASSSSFNPGGAGAYVIANSSGRIILSRCHIHDNAASGVGQVKGAAVWMRTLGTASAEAVDNLIEDNSGSSSGSGTTGTGLNATNYSTEPMILRRNVFLGNTGNDSSEPQIELDVVDGSMLMLTDTVVAAADAAGVGAYCGGTIHVVNLTVAEHTGNGLLVSLYGSGVASVANTIAYGNGGFDAQLDPSTTTSANLFGTDPLFVDPVVALDFRVLPGSPAIDMGNGSVAGLGPWDADGHGSVRRNGFVDIGAYEDQTGVIFADGFEQGTGRWSSTN